MKKQRPSSPNLYTLERQTRSNKKTNRDKQSDLMDLSSLITWKGRTIDQTQCAAMRSNTQSSVYHMGRENNRAVSMRSNHMQVRIEATNEIN